MTGIDALIETIWEGQRGDAGGAIDALTDWVKERESGRNYLDAIAVMGIQENIWDKEPSEQAQWLLEKLILAAQLTTGEHECIARVDHEDDSSTMGVYHGKCEGVIYAFSEYEPKDTNISA